MKTVPAEHNSNLKQLTIDKKNISKEYNIQENTQNHEAQGPKDLSAGLRLNVNYSKYLTNINENASDGAGSRSSPGNQNLMPKMPGMQIQAESTGETWQKTINSSPIPSLKSRQRKEPIFPP